MCGIVGLFLKNPDLRPKLGAMVAEMLDGMASRGPDSAGLAIYHRPAAEGAIKLTLAGCDDWAGLAEEMADGLGVGVKGETIGVQGLLTAQTDSATALAWLKAHAADVRIVGYGSVMEVYKDTGLPDEVIAKFALGDTAGTHAVGHTRMATESAVTTAGSHPFTATDDMCLVHNGSLSNYFRLRGYLERQGLAFETENDSEVAAKYFAWRLSQGLPLNEALRAGFKDLDGFYTFAMGIRDGFAVVRDGIGCKPAQLAETDDWVAMASEFRSIAGLPGVENAKLWEPEPGRVYSWTLDGEQMAAVA